MSQQVELSVDIIGRLELDENLLDSCDLISLIFLLYEFPEEAFNTILLYQRTSERSSRLKNWAQSAQNRPDWQDEFLEALFICKLYGVIRKLGYNVQEIKNKYNSNEQPQHVDPMKKSLYSLCENIKSNNISKLIEALDSYDINVREYGCCELFLLHLLSNKFITINYLDKQAKEYDVEALAEIICRLPDLKRFAEDIRNVQKLYSNTPQRTLASNLATDDNHEESDDDDLSSLNYKFEKLNACFDETVASLRSDSSKPRDDMYPIKDPNRTGVCYIINQEEFYPSAGSIAIEGLDEPLEDRIGSSVDKSVLSDTMQKKKFYVLSSDNLKHKLMISCIKYVIRREVRPNDSMFMLCILSHGTKGHVYGADSVKVKVDDIEDIVSQELLLRKILIPKIMVIEACQINGVLDEATSYRNIVDFVDILQPDSAELLICHNGDNISLQPEAPSSVVVQPERSVPFKKAHNIRLWATSPELIAYRYSFETLNGVSIPQGSIFIRNLCKYINSHGNKIHVLDIFTKVNNGVATMLAEQVATCTYSLTKDLYLMYPE